jgi:hypothetical protein
LKISTINEIKFIYLNILIELSKLEDECDGDFISKSNIKDDIWGAENRNSPNYQNRDFELTTLLCVICYKD